MASTDIGFEREMFFFEFKLFVSNKTELEEIKAFVLSSPQYLLAKNQKDDTLLHIALDYEYKELAKWLVSKDLPINERGFMDRTPLHLAARMKDPQLIAHFLERDANPAVFDACRYSPLIPAIETGSSSVLKLLLENCATADRWKLLTGGYRTPLQTALGLKDKTCAGILLNYMLLANKKKYETTYLVGDAYYTARLDFPEFLKMLLVKCRERMIRLIDSLGKSMLYDAMTWGKMATALFLLGHGVDRRCINERNDFGETMLFSCHNSDAVRNCIELGVDIEACNNWGYPVLFFVRDSREMTRLILTHAALLKVQGKSVAETEKILYGKNWLSLTERGFYEECQTEIEYLMEFKSGEFRLFDFLVRNPIETALELKPPVIEMCKGVLKDQRFRVYRKMFLKKYKIVTDLCAPAIDRQRNFIGTLPAFQFLVNDVLNHVIYHLRENDLSYLHTGWTEADGTR